jgi:hypothetical protein
MHSHERVVGPRFTCQHSSPNRIDFCPSGVTHPIPVMTTRRSTQLLLELLYQQGGALPTGESVPEAERLPHSRVFGVALNESETRIRIGIRNIDRRWDGVAIQGHDGRGEVDRPGTCAVVT